MCYLPYPWCRAHQLLKFKCSKQLAFRSFLELAIGLKESWVLHELSSNQNIETGMKLEPILSSINFLQEPSLSIWKLGLTRCVLTLNLYDWLTKGVRVQILSIAILCEKNYDGWCMCMCLHWLENNLHFSLMIDLYCNYLFCFHSLVYVWHF